MRLLARLILRSRGAVGLVRQVRQLVRDYVLRMKPNEAALDAGQTDDPDPGVRLIVGGESRNAKRRATLKPDLRPMVVSTEGTIRVGAARREEVV